MDINKWKSVAVKIKDYELLKGLCKDKFRAPGAMISKMLQGYIEHLAKKNKVSVENFRKQLLNGESNDDGKRSKKSRH
jgi:hypothetical protein